MPAATAIAQLRDRLGADVVTDDPAECWSYGYDNSRRHVAPAAVVRPDSPESVKTAIEICNQTRTPVTARGYGSGTTGAAVPSNGGIVLSTERLTTIHRIDPDNRAAVVQAGVTNGAVQRAVAEHGFFWAPDPTSADYSTVGGNLACNAAGPRAVKYGTTRDNTLGLRAVTGDGRELRTGVYTTKGVVGYDLTRLLIGSEGTLALITEATLMLRPLPEAICTIRAVYSDVNSAAAAVARIMAQPVIPRVLELMDEAATNLVRSSVTLPADGRALLLVEVDGPAAHLDDAAAAIHTVAGPGLVAFDQSVDDHHREELWSARRALSPALRTLAPEKINEDVVVPVSRLSELIAALVGIGNDHGVTIVNFGHAGNGNIHVNLLGQTDQLPDMRRCLAKLMQTVVSLGGTLSGEHGVGLDKRDFVSLEIEPETLGLMRAIKQQFDPNGILNPGKMFPDLPGL